MTFFKTILSVIFLIASSKAMEPATTEVFGLFKGLHAPFQDNKGQPHKYAHFSPIHGVNNQIIKNLRLHGHYEPENKGFPRPNWDRKDSNTFPQDATASFLELLFPSHIGFLVDSCPSSPFHTWLKPRNIALIFNTISTPGFYENPIQGTINLARALQPEANFKQLDDEERKRLLHMPKGNPKKEVGNKEQKGPAQLKYGAYSKLKSLAPAKLPSTEMPFAELLFLAFQETTDECASDKGYPQYVVERILLTYMWEKKKSKEDLKSFYEFLHSDIIDKCVISDIFWSGEGSYYSEKDYWIAKEYSILDDRQINLEVSTLLKLGYSYFEDKFPPAISYGVSHIYINGKWESYSDCGETSLRDFFMMLLYNFATKKFDWTLFESLKEKGLHIRESLIDYFRTICPSPAYTESQKSRDEWAKVLFDLNTGNEINKIDYLYPTLETGKYAIAPGLDNMLRVIGNLLGDPKWDKKDLCFSPITTKLLRLCKLFKPIDSTPWYWEERSKSNLSPNERGKINPKDVTLLFKLKGNGIFEWHFEEHHFDFNRADHSKTIPCLDYNHFSVIPADLSEVSFPAYFYSNNLDSVKEKCMAIQKIRCYQEQFNKDTFRRLKNRWIEPTGRYFAYWNDYHTNENVAYHHSVNDVLEMNIPELTAHLMWNCVHYHGLPHIPSAHIRHIFASDKNKFILEERPFHNYNYKRMARTLALTLEKGSKRDIVTLMNNGANEYVLEISGIPLLHLATYAGFELAYHFIDSIDPNNAECLNERTKDGYTPLHFAVQCVSREHNALKALLNLPKIDVNAKNKDGNTPLHLAAHSEAPTEFLKMLIEKGANINAINNKGQTPLDMACDYLMENKPSSERTIKYLIESGAKLKKEYKEGISYTENKSSLERNIRFLIESGATVEKGYKKGISYLDWAISQNLSPYIVFLLKKAPIKPYIPPMTLSGFDFAEISSTTQNFEKSELYYGHNWTKRNFLSVGADIERDN